MHEALSFLAELDSADVSWFLEESQERRVPAGEVLIREAAVPEHLFVVSDGLLEVRLDSLGGRQLSKVGPGELLGEMSFVEDEPASATVAAVEESCVLATSRVSIEARCGEDPAFAQRLYKALARIVSRRLRRRVGSLDLAQGDPSLLTSSSTGRVLGPSLAVFKDLVKRIDEEARRSGGELPHETVEEARRMLDGLSMLLKEARYATAGEFADDAVRQEITDLVGREMHPYILLTRIAERIYSKPRGYAGDYLTIEWMYRNETGGTGAAGPLIDAAILDRPAARAVRNRRHLLAREIVATARSADRPARVTSLACGPAEELFDTFSVGLDDPSRLAASCIDIDLQALALVSDRLEREGIKRHVQLHQGNLVFLATGRQELDLEPQDLVYSIGLTDYFQDRFVIKLLDWIHDKLKPGGRVILGNFHPRNPDRGLMECVLDWHLIHRDEADMNRLFESSKFGAPCEEIRFEEEGVNLFAFGLKR